MYNYLYILIIALDKYSSANPNIEFDNKKYDESLTQIN